MRNVAKKTLDQKATLAEKNLSKTIRYFEKKGIPVYWKLDAEANIIVITTDLKVAKEKGCTRALFS